jgi:hypothetical protein
MQNKFKIGDRVRISKYYSSEFGRDVSHPIGSIHIIASIAYSSYRLKNDHLGPKGGYLYEESELEFANNALQRLKERYGKKKKH